MYPYGSGYPPNNQAPYPGAYPPSNQAPYPNTSPFPNAPFGAGYPSQPSYPPAAGGYPPNQSMPSYGGYPPAPGQSAYPPQAGQMPYPAASGNSPYPPVGETGAYPSAGGAYPPQPGYPPSQPPAQPGYPPAQPGYPPAQPGYPPAQPGYPSSQPGYPSQPGYMPGSTNAQYPGQATNPSPYPNVGGANQGGAPYPGQTAAPAHNMAQCFSEMKSTVQGIRNESKGTPTVLPADPFDPVGDANSLRKAMKGFGTDEAALINIICRRSNDQRQQIDREFKTSFGKNLIDEIKSEISGNFQELMVAMLTPIVEYYVMQIHSAMADAGTDEDVLIETLCSLSNNEISTIKNAYHYRYHMPLESQLKSETSGVFERLLVSLCNAGRDESGMTDMQQATNDAQQLYQAGVARFGTDEATFNLVLCRRNYAQLKLVFQEYEKIAGHSIETAIKKEFSGDIEDGLMAIVRCAMNRPEYFARRLHKAMAGFGTNDNQLIRLLVTRSEVDLQDVKVAFEMKYGKSLKSWIKGEASGHYKKCLLALIGEEN